MYSASDLTKDLILNDVDELNLEYRYDMGFKNQLKKKRNKWTTTKVLITANTKCRLRLSTEPKSVFAKRFGFFAVDRHRAGYDRQW